MKEIDILTAAIKVFGEKPQEEVAIEEMAELIQAISHKHRGRKNNIAEEIADVEIMIEQLKVINGCTDDVQKIRNEKVIRLYEKVFNECL